MNKLAFSLKKKSTGTLPQPSFVAHGLYSETSNAAKIKDYILKIALVFVIIVPTLGLAACSSNNTSTGATANPAQNNSSNNRPESNSSETVKIAEGALAPDFEFSTPEGETARLSDFKGKVVLLNFWATWCGYCIDEMPAMQKITENFSDSVVVLAINRGDVKADATEFIEESNYDYVWGLDEDMSIQKLYPANGIPYSIIIDEEGIIGTIFEGSAPDMYPYFEEALTLAGA